LLGLVVLVLAFIACQTENPTDLLPTEEKEPLATPSVSVKSLPGKIIRDAFIVQLKQDLPELAETVTPRSERPIAPGSSSMRQTPVQSINLAQKILQENNLPESRIDKVYGIPGSKGFSITASNNEIAKLKKDPRIEFIEPDRTVALGLNPGTKDRLIPSDDGPATQALTYGVSRVGGAKEMSSTYYWAWIMDSGIDLDHEDLNVQTTFARSFLDQDPSFDDEFGHGTHVAGIIAAKDNGIGIVGVAAGAPVVPIRVLDENGEGKVSDLIDALNYIGRYTLPGDVVNMSIGSEKSEALDAAVEALKNSYGVSIVISAGNSGKETKDYSPANLAENNIYVVGAINENDAFSSFSNYGANVSYVAPGEKIYSTYKDNQYASISGTSMAAPHLAAIILIKNQSGYSMTNAGSISLPSGNQANVPKWE
jgi:hypothetical protein